MRFHIVSALLLFSTTTAVAQTRWTLSAGPEWQPYVGGQFIGGRIRGEFDVLKQDKPFRLRMELGTYWEPTQDHFGTSPVDGSTFGRTRQTMDVSFGFSAAVSPLPRARFGQTWIRGFDARFPAGGQPTYSPFSGTLGELAYPVGFGIRARIGSRVLQFELRRFLAEHRNGLMVGTRLPF